MNKKSLANNSTKKRKILFGTLIPITVIGITLGTVLPLTLCHKHYLPYQKLKVGDTIHKIVFTGMTSGIDSNNYHGMNFSLANQDYLLEGTFLDAKSGIVYWGLLLYDSSSKEWAESYVDIGMSIVWDKSKLTLTYNKSIHSISLIWPEWSYGKSPLQTAHYYLY